jgi:hypothetical protein
MAPKFALSGRRSNSLATGHSSTKAVDNFVGKPVGRPAKPRKFTVLDRLPLF